MYILEDYISHLLTFLSGSNKEDVTIIRKHSRKLESLGEISFPLNINNWYHIIDRNSIVESNFVDILQYSGTKGKLDSRILELKEKCKDFQIDIEKITVKENDVHLYLKRNSSLYRTVILDVLSKRGTYGSSNIFTSRTVVDCDYNNQNIDLSEMDLSTLRLLELRDVSSNFLAFTTRDKSELGSKIIFTLNSNSEIKNLSLLLCGPVLNETGVKDVKTRAQELFDKRTMDMRLMAEHRYKVQVIPNTPHEDYFIKSLKKLGRSCVTIELLSNKPTKAVKVNLNDLRTANKGAAFIFYNCARMSVLLKEFEKRTSKGMYPNLPDVSEIDFSTLNQPEEWELFYVYILQFPMVVRSCIRDISKAIFNPQYLITFLSNFSSLFSAYYRRVRILTDPREHLFNVLHARIYLLKALQVVFHNALLLLNIEPIKEM